MNLWTIPIVFVFLASAMAWIIIGVKGHWCLKLTMMILSVLLAVQIWSAANSYLGYSKPSTMEEMKGVRASILWTWVAEPDYIYLWLIVGKEEPRVYRFPYSRPLHKNTVEAMDQILQDKGEPVEVVIGQNPNKGSNANEYGGARGGQGDGGGASSDAIGEFYILPPALVSPKVQNRTGE